jgi:hypothetical protein
MFINFISDIRVVFGYATHYCIRPMSSVLFVQSVDQSVDTKTAVPMPESIGARPQLLVAKPLTRPVSCLGGLNVKQASHAGADGPGLESPDQKQAVSWMGSALRKLIFSRSCTFNPRLQTIPGGHRPGQVSTKRKVTVADGGQAVSAELV